MKRREQTRLAGNVLLVARPWAWPWPFSEGAMDEPVPLQASQQALAGPTGVCRRVQAVQGSQASQAP